ncbi:nucleotide sugar dehydrogenase [Deltaproteobacteria bacterium]|nr:nucleotide sugar dehydrogenase [Deltaproteobacteria bacterium]
MFNKSLIDKINKKSAVIGIIGLGYIGLPLKLRFSEVGYRTIGFDIDQSKVDNLRNGKSHIEQISSKAIVKAINNGSEFTSDFSRFGEVDVIMICVPTPINQSGEPDISYIINVTNSIIPYLKNGQIVALESTTYPGTTDEVLKPMIESTGLRVGEDVFLVYSPERLDPGNPKFVIKNTPKICSGTTLACLEVGLELYRKAIEKVVPVSSTQTAEFTKLLENIQRAVNIALVNEMKIIAHGMGLDIHEVIRAAASKSFGFMTYYPGPGVGGHCIPINPPYLTWKAKEYGLKTRLIETAYELNRSMPELIVSKITESLNKHHKFIVGSKILVLGIAYKKNIDDTRESPSIKIMELLQQQGAELNYSDPHVPVLPKLCKLPTLLSSVVLSAKAIKSYDCIVIATDHDQFDYQLIKEHAELIIDTRGVYLKPRANIVKA